MYSNLTRRSFIWAGGVLSQTAWPAASHADDWEHPPPPDKAGWKAIADIAQAFVARESPPSIFPFAAPDRAALGRSSKKVFAHYFPPYPLSFDNKDVSEDYYTTQYLKRTGENSKFFKVGGLIRDRPLSPGHLDSPYWRQINYAIEILRAQAIGLDGFGIDIVQLGQGPYWSFVHLLLDTAAAVAPDFRIMPEPDTDILKTFSPAEIAEELALISKHPASYHLPDGRLVVAPFAPDVKPLEFWTALIKEMKQRQKPIAFLPVYLNTAVAASFAPVSYGLSVWSPRDPHGPDPRKQLGANPVFASKVWMMPVVPQDVRPKSPSFWETENTGLFRHQWDQAIEGNYEYAHLITWNDFSETTEVSPGSETGFLFYDLTRYYTIWFKTGKAPAISKDAIYYCHRRQIIKLDYSPVADETPMHLHGTAVSNKVEMVALLTAPATLQIEMAGTLTNLDAQPGLTSLLAAAAPGRPIFRILRGKHVVLETRSKREIVAHPDEDDHTYLGGSSMR